MQSLRRLIHHFVVHGAAKKRVRMANDGCKACVCARRGPERGLDSPGPAFQKNTAMEYFSHKF